MEPRNISFRFYTPSWEDSLKVYQAIEGLPTRYSPQLATVVASGWEVSCYLTEKDANSVADLCSGPVERDGNVLIIDLIGMKI